MGSTEDATTENFFLSLFQVLLCGIFNYGQPDQSKKLCTGWGFAATISQKIQSFHSQSKRRKKLQENSGSIKKTLSLFQVLLCGIFNYGQPDQRKKLCSGWGSAATISQKIQSFHSQSKRREKLQENSGSIMKTLYGCILSKTLSMCHYPF